MFLVNFLQKWSFPDQNLWDPPKPFKNMKKEVQNQSAFSSKRGIIGPTLFLGLVKKWHFDVFGPFLNLPLFRKSVFGVLTLGGRQA